MSRYKFRTEQEYYEWCASIVSRINYGLIAMNNEGVQKVVDEIMSTLHIPEGDSLIADAEDLVEERLKALDELTKLGQEMGDY